MGRTPKALLEACKNPPGELKIQDKTMLTVSECAEARRFMEENAKAIAPCYNRKYDPFG